MGLSRALQRQPPAPITSGPPDWGMGVLRTEALPCFLLLCQSQQPEPSASQRRHAVCPHNFKHAFSVHVASCLVTAP